MDSSRGSVTAGTGPQARRRAWQRPAILAAVLVALACAVFAWWGQPRLGDGSIVAPGPGMAWANDGIENTRMVVRGRPVATAAARFSIRNDGHLAFTVHGLDVADTTGWLSKQHATFAPGPGEDRNAPGSARVTLDPGDEAAVYWSLDLACRPALPADGFVHIDALRFRLTWLGIPTTREMPLEQPITFVGDDTSRPPPGPDCADD